MENMKLSITRVLSKYYRNIKSWFFIHRPPLITGLFFYGVSMLNDLLSSRRLTKMEKQMNQIWKYHYIYYYKDHPDQLFRLKTKYPVAYESDDHKFPHGTLVDNSKNYNFNLKFYRQFGWKDDASVLDLGCSGGAFVRSFLEDGYIAMGLEGSDVSKKHRSGEWDTIPYHLFTCNIVKPFQIHTGNGKKANFDVITAWEVMEHIPEDVLPQLVENILLHLKPNGYFICSIAFHQDGDPITGAVYHKTLRSGEWWKEYFQAHGLYVVSNHPFETGDMVRGNGLSVKDWHPDDGSGIHLVLGKKKSS